MPILFQVLMMVGMKLAGKVLQEKDLHLYGRLASELADKLPEIIKHHGYGVEFMDIDWLALKMPEWDAIDDDS